MLPHLARVPDVVAGILADLADLVLPSPCAGCAATGLRLRYGVCGGCADALVNLAPAGTRPDPAPPGLPPVTTLGTYQGVLREVLLAYKERGRHPLAPPLGGLLAEVVRAAVPAGPALIVPVPSTPRAVRQRHGDHVARLLPSLSRRLRRSGRVVEVHRVLRALPRADSAGLTSGQRAAAAITGFAGRERGLTRLSSAAAGTPVVIVDDIVTTGATLASTAAVLRTAGVEVAAAAVLAATSRRRRVHAGPDRG